MRKQINLVLAATVAITTVGCSGMANDNTQSVDSSDAASMVELQAAKRRVTELESKLAESDRRIAANQTASQAVMPASGSTSSLFPPNPKPGQCYARVLTPAKYRNISERVLVRDASEHIEILPARYETVEQRVLVKEASSRLEVVPAVYETVEERVLVKPASESITEVPAKYRTESERVVDQPAHTAWKKGPAAKQTSNVLSQTTTDTGELMCLVEVPATYKTIEKRVLVSPARTVVSEIPAEYKTVNKRVVKTPATTREVTIPAQYDTITVTRLVSPASEKRIAIPASYDDVTRQEMVAAEQMDWRQVVCEINLTANNVKALQRALQDKGYYKAGIDGIFGSQTLNAAQSFAASNDLPAGSNYIPVAVIKELGLDI